MKINRVWAMPNKNTFTIKPIKDLLNRYLPTELENLVKNMVIVDPFANDCKLGTITNDLCPDFDTDFHLDALQFLKERESESADIVLFDPPYSISQAAECYKSYGKDKLEINVANMAYWAECKNEISRILKPNGIVICCGWSTNGLGKGRNFEIVEILIVPHGGSKNDTLVTVEKKAK